MRDKRLNAEPGNCWHYQTCAPQDARKSWETAEPHPTRRVSLGSKGLPFRGKKGAIHRHAGPGGTPAGEAHRPGSSGHGPAGERLSGTGPHACRQRGRVIQEEWGAGGGRAGPPRTPLRNVNELSRLLKNSLLPRLLIKVQMQGGARGEVRGVLGPYVAAPRERANAADGPFSAAC